MITLKIAGNDREFTGASVTNDLANASSSATLTFRRPADAAWDAPMDAVLLGEDPMVLDFGARHPFETVNIAGAPGYATTLYPYGNYAPDANQALYADENNPQPTDAIYL